MEWAEPVLLVYTRRQLPCTRWVNLCLRTTRRCTWDVLICRAARDTETVVPSKSSPLSHSTAHCNFPHVQFLCPSCMHCQCPSQAPKPTHPLQLSVTSPEPTAPTSAVNHGTQDCCFVASHQTQCLPHTLAGLHGSHNAVVMSVCTGRCRAPGLTVHGTHKVGQGSLQPVLGQEGGGR